MVWYKNCLHLVSDSIIFTGAAKQLNICFTEKYVNVIYFTKQSLYLCLDIVNTHLIFFIGYKTTHSQSYTN